ncbi:MAG: TetR/AcrR family transcriptional regulator [Clostridia bacterium]|nr:TetR/AcrR family transcriptional regulator [Clostridia bacterium]
MADNKSTREQIIEAALEILSKKASFQLTTREVVEKANVNIAAVNYYFGSKDNLIEQAIEFLLKKLYEILNEMKDDSVPPKKRLYNFSFKFLELTDKYPGIVKNIVSTLMFEENTSESIKKMIPEFTSIVSDVIRQLSPKDRKYPVEYHTSQFIVNLVFPQLFYNSYPTLFNDSNAKNKIRNEYISFLLDNI